MRAVVLGGGGIVGVAWGCGYLAGLADAGVDLRGADRVIGTSAGSVVGAWLVSGAIPRRLRFVERADRPFQRLLGSVARAFSASRSPLREQALELLYHPEPSDETLLELARIADRAPTMPEPLFVALVRALVGGGGFRAAPQLRVTAIDTGSGKRVVLGPDDGIGLARGCAASSAVPGVFPPVRVDGRKLMDGGCLTATNADLAEGAERALVVSLLAHEGANPPAAMSAEVAALEQLGTRVYATWPDEATLAVAGENLLDSRVAPAVAQAGRQQGRREAAAVRAVWGSLGAAATAEAAKEDA